MATQGPSMVDRSNEFHKLKTVGKGTAGRADLVMKKSDKSQWVLKVVEVNTFLLACEIVTRACCRTQGEFQPESETKKLNQASWEEVMILSKISHENIIRYEDSWSQGTTLMILMEYADGGTLEDKWKAACKTQKRFPEELVMKWTVQLLQAVNYCHSVHILHRDIKLANIMLSGDDNIKLGDFGLARLLDTQNFMAQTCCGTPYYISPELCRGEAYDSKADVWALGCVIYELCALQRPAMTSRHDALHFHPRSAGAGHSTDPTCTPW